MLVLEFFNYVFFIVVSIQVIFYFFFFGSFAFSKRSSKPLTTQPVSVIIAAKNEASNLKRFLPSIISQEYSTFEIILINDNSSDDTFKVMQGFNRINSNIKLINFKSTDTFFSSKKQALTLGVKASKYKQLLFTDADCKPVSKYWIKTMCTHFSKEKVIVLGYGKYAEIKYSFLNKVIRFETLMAAIQYVSYAKNGIPYMGVGRNLAYTKDVFLEANGYGDHIKIHSGDDDLFINKVANHKNTAVCIDKESFTESIPEASYKSWMRQKRRHISTAKYYKIKHKVLLSIFYLSNLFFWLLAAILFANTGSLFTVTMLFLLRMAMQFVVIGIASKKLNENHLLIWLPVLEIFLIAVQLTIFIKNLISKPDFWK